MSKGESKTTSTVGYLFFGAFAIAGVIAFLGSAYTPFSFWLSHGYWQESPTGIIFGSIFLLSHGGIGFSGLWWLWNQRNASDDIGNTDSSEPWLSQTYWANSKIDSDLVSWAPTVKKIAWFFIAVALIDLFAIYESVKREEFKALYGLIIPAIAALLFYWSKRQEKRLTKYGAMPLQMDPYPAAIGGHCGGTIAVNYLDSELTNSIVLLQCIRYYSVKTSDGDRTESDILWEDRMVPAWRRTIDGHELAFCFDIPEDRKLSAAQDREQLPRIVWEISVSATGEGGGEISREYENIPVFKTTGRSSIRDIQAFAAQSHATKKQYDASLDKLMPYKPSGGDGYSLHYPFGRNLNGITGIVLGSVFIVSGVLIPHLLFNIVFPLLGGLCVVGGAYQIANSLTVHISSDFIETTRYLFGIAIKKRTLPSYDFKEFKATKVSSSTTKGPQRQFFNIYATGNGGQKLVVAEKIDGEGQVRAAVDRLLGFFNR